MKSTAGFFRYLRFIVRRERATTPIWIVSLALASFGVAIAFTNLFPTPEDLTMMAQTMLNPAMQALIGPVYGLDSLTPTMLMAQQMLVFMIITVAIMNIFFVIRHTRNDEEQGRLEMLRALPIGRLTGAASTLFFAFIANLVISLSIVAALLLSGLEGMNFHGALVYSFAIGASGFLFAAITLLMAQLFSTARGALTGAFITLGIFYIARAFGDMSGNIMSYLSPIGLALQVSSFYENLIWPILVVLGIAIITGIIALTVCSRRDLGEGIIPARKGKAHASAFLQRPAGLAWRLMRGQVIAWSIGMFVFGATYGAVIGDIESFVAGNEMFQHLLGLGEADPAYSIANSFISLILAIMAMTAVVPVIFAATKLRSEEKRGRTESIFARAVKRSTMFRSYIIIAAVGSAWLMLCAGIGFYAAAATSGLVNAGEIIGAALMYVPAMLAVMGLCVLLVGLVPKLTGLVWALIAYSFITVYFGSLLGLPEWMAKLSPFGNIPQMPTAAFSATPIIILSVIAIGLTFIGIKAYRRRDIGNF